MSQNIEPPEALVIAADSAVSWEIEWPHEARKQLEEHLSAAMGLPVHIVVNHNYEETLAGLKRGTIDAAKLGPYAFALAQARLGVRALANPVDKADPREAHAPPYRSLIITRADSENTHLTQLKGQSFGFVDPGSTTGYLVATFLLQQAGIDPEADILPRFLHNHRAVAEAVLSGEVAAGAIMESEYLSYSQQEPTRLRVLAASPLLSRGPIVVRPGLARGIERKLLQALEQLHLVDQEYTRLLMLPDQRFIPAVQREMTLKTVAELAGVSYATVSRAINGNGRIAPQTTARILKLVEELGYRPNINARRLHKPQGDLIGLLLPSLSYPGLNEIVDGMQARLSAAHLHLLICTAGKEQPAHERAYFEMLANSRFEGLFLTQWHALDPQVLELMRSGHPTVLLEQDLLEEGLLAGWQWLSAQGQRHIELIVGPSSLLEPTAARRKWSQLGGAACSFGEASELSAGWLDERLQQATPSTAFFCSDDVTALRLQRMLKRRQGAQLVLGYGNSLIAQSAGLPSLAYDGQALGKLVAGRLLKMLNLASTDDDADVCFWVQANHETSS
ncbi:phosphate/phosphite/phosphonate ABC transporter substrate-binding protein [Ktedonosporobacter rubrisoli]|uniref:Phosphate/phosphite/phosphonate ABC transporter substrate-binding protein n=1 Tax=Ktedonosporobacter rubrisoli TaxID=2509675 RepID=A0A4P6JMA4_KTERU|nr:phosphate/phosphite/phosphonate ABC transporter substrate-binding protein [Ktedonosporobacter rubrisoli]QBD76378.1 phosphate/phosphite/phosphonate ABC transporter substrate-binding protein [Ktedonosporobacter rubrisoli]